MFYDLHVGWFIFADVYEFKMVLGRVGVIWEVNMYLGNKFILNTVIFRLNNKNMKPCLL